jgi:hypothetical protein
MRTSAWIPAILTAGMLAAQDDHPKCRKCGTDTYGTSVEWAQSPAEAAEQAKKEEKLVFVLHVSGYFEDPKFT